MPINQQKNPPANKVQEEIIAQESKPNVVKRELFLGKNFEFFEVVLPHNYAFYNLENYRTTLECKRYIKEENLPEDTFSLENYDSKLSQEHYHKLIYKKVQKEKLTEYQETFDSDKGNQSQTENLFLTYEGILANGNSRTSWWRENEPNFTQVRYWVFPKNTDFRDIEDAVLTLDAKKDITNQLPWYNKAHRARARLAELGTPDSKQRKEIAKKEQYVTEKKMNEEIGMLELAEEFVQQNFKGFSDILDLNEIGRGSGNQAFKTLYQKDQKKNDDQFKSILSETWAELKIQSFGIIADPSKYSKLANVKDAHIGIGQIYEDQRLKEMAKADQKKGEEDPLAPKKPKKKQPAKPKKNSKQLSDDIVKALKEGQRNQKVKKIEDAEMALAKMLDEKTSELKGLEKLINDKETNHKEGHISIKKLIDAAQDIEKTLSKILNS